MDNRTKRELAAEVTELATILGRGFLRLTEKRIDSGVPGRGEPQIPLDVSAPESPYMAADGRPRCKPACSTRSTGSGR